MNEQAHSRAIDEFDVGHVKETMTSVSQNLIDQERIIANGGEVESFRQLNPLPSRLCPYWGACLSRNISTGARSHMPPLSYDAPSKNPEVFGIAAKEAAWFLQKA